MSLLMWLTKYKDAVGYELVSSRPQLLQLAARRSVWLLSKWPTVQADGQPSFQRPLDSVPRHDSSWLIALLMCTSPSAINQQQRVDAKQCGTAPDCRHFTDPNHARTLFQQPSHLDAWPSGPRNHCTPRCLAVVVCAKFANVSKEPPPNTRRIATAKRSRANIMSQYLLARAGGVVNPVKNVPLV